MELRLNALQGTLCMMYDIIVSKTSVFVRPHVNDKPRFSKISFLESVFEKDAFSVNVFTRYVKTVGQTAE